MQLKTINCMDPAAPTPYVDHAASMGCLFVAICGVDCLLRGAFPSPKVRWFALHFLINMAMASLCIGDIVGIVRSPFCAFLEPAGSYIPTHGALTLHIYHLLFFTGLRREDIVHHLLFAGVLGAFAISFSWGRMINVSIFFMSGVPGGVDYALLVLVKTGRMARLQQKAITSAINTWVRTPGLCFCATLMLVCSWQRVVDVPYPAVTMSAIAALTLLNGIYYGEQAVGTYHRLAALSPSFADKQYTGDTPELRSSRKEGSARDAGTFELPPSKLSRDSNLYAQILAKSQ